MRTLIRLCKSAKKSVTTLLLIISSIPAWANESEFFQWHSTNIQLLRGVDYELGSQRRTIMTIEHANRWRYGDFYIFGDKDWPDTGSSSYYFEPTLRISLSKVADTQFTNKWVKDVFLAAQLEKPKGQSGRPLAGIAVDLNLPGFTFFKTMVFWRDNPDLAGNTQQFTVAWNYPFEAYGVNFLTEGFADLAGAEGRTVSHQLFVPRLLADVGAISGLTNNTLWLGVEWQYWHNKFGVDGITESVPQLQVKYVI